jgi:hypothetical protein
MVIFVSNDVTQAEEMLEIWVKAGVPGVTILESSGMQRAVRKGLRDDFGLFVSLRKLMESDEIQHRTLFSAVQDQETLDRIVKASTDHVGDWSKPDTGLLLVLPLVQAYGFNKDFRK